MCVRMWNEFLKITTAVWGGVLVSKVQKYLDFIQAQKFSC
jgi:hypothetical protein